MTDALRKKVKQLLAAHLGVRHEGLAEDKLHPVVIDRIARAHAGDLGLAQATKLGMHMSDWVGDAAFVVALHLFPDQFSDEEIRDGVGLFLCHAPNHIRAACGITGNDVWEDFPDDDER